MLVYLNLLVLIASVPRTPHRWRYIAAVLLLVTSFPALRTSADGNTEILVTLGALLLLFGYEQRNPLGVAAGVLIISAKPQSSLLLLLVAALFILQTWNPREWLQIAVPMLVVIIPTMIWRGEDWLAAVDGTYQRGSIIDVSIDAALARTGAVPIGVRWLVRGLLLALTAFVIWGSQRTISREKAGMLIAVSLLLAPYSAGNSVLAVLSIGVIPLFIKDVRLGGLLIFLVNIPYIVTFINRSLLYDYQSYFWTLYLLVVWGLLGWRIYNRELATPITPPQETITAS